MTNLTEQTISFKEICYVTELSSQTIIEIVEQGIVSPVGDLPEHWVFNANMVTITKKAYRLHRDLDIDWSGVALVVGLVKEIETIKRENEQLKRRLSRFVSEN